MSVFISYKTEDRELAQNVRQAIATATRLEVWWDQDLQTGGRWNQALDEALGNATAIVVLWTERSTKSPWVIQEAAIAAATDRLVPARLDDCEPPAPFRGTQTADLRGWKNDEKAPSFQKLVAGIMAIASRRLGRGTRWRWFRTKPVRFAVGLLVLLLTAGIGWLAASGAPRLETPPGVEVVNCGEMLSRLDIVAAAATELDVLVTATRKAAATCRPFIDWLETRLP